MQHSARSFLDRDTIASLKIPTSEKVLPLARYLARFFMRGSFFSLIQLLEAFFLIRNHFFYIPPSSVGVLAVLSVAHTGALAMALSFRKITGHLRALPALANVNRRPIISALISAVVASFGILSLALLGIIIATTSIHFSSPPIYRAMLTGWIVTLPIEVGIVLGLYTARQRGLALFGDRLTGYLALGSLFGCFSVIANLPLLYLAARLTFLLLSWRLVYPKHLSSNEPTLERREVQVATRRALPQLFRIGFGSASLELAPKLACLPIAHYDPSFALTLVVAQRLIQLASASSLRVADLLHREVRRWIAFGSTQVRARAFSRAFSTLTVTSIFTLILFPIMAVRYTVVSWSSPYNEHVDPSLIVVILFVGLLAMRPTILGMARLVEDTPGTGMRNSNPCLALGIIGLTLSTIPNVALWSGHSLNLTTAQSAQAVLLSEIVLLFTALAWLRTKVVGGTLWTWSDLGILSLRRAQETAPSRHLLLLKAPKELRHVLYRATLELKEAPLVSMSPTALLTPDKPKTRAVFETHPAEVEISAGTLQNILHEILHPTRSFRGRDRLRSETRRRFIELASFVTSRGEATPAIPPNCGIELIRLDEALTSTPLSGREECARYLDLLLLHGSVITHHGLTRSARGVLHLNCGDRPSHLVLVGTETRMYFSEFGYVALHHNLFQAGLEGSPWPPSSQTASLPPCDPHPPRAL